MAALTVRTLDRTGSLGTLTDLAEAAAALGDYFENDGATVLAVVNGSAGAVNVTVAFGSRAIIDGTAPPGRVLTVAAGKTSVFGFWKPYDWNDANGRVQLTYDTVTTIKVLAFKPSVT